jgi:hypothetical protein
VLFLKDAKVLLTGCCEKINICAIKEQGIIEQKLEHIRVYLYGVFR